MDELHKYKIFRWVHDKLHYQGYEEIKIMAVIDKVDEIMSIEPENININEIVSEITNILAN